MFWVELSDFSFPLITTQLAGSARPHGGAWAAWLGGVYGTSTDDAVTAIVQRVTVSPSKPYLTYWHWVASAEACGAFDVAGVAVGYGAPDPDVVDAIDLCARNNTGGWRRRVVDMRKYVGQTVGLIFLAGTDNTLNSNWFLDDVAFQPGALANQADSAPENTDPANSHPRGNRGSIQSSQSDVMPHKLVKDIRATLNK